MRGTTGLNSKSTLCTIGYDFIINFAFRILSYVTSRFSEWIFSRFLDRYVGYCL